MEIVLKDLAPAIGAEIEGDENIIVNSFAQIEKGRKGSISFLANPKYEHYIYTTEASAVLVRKDLELQHPVKTTLLRVEDPYVCIAHLMSFAQKMRPMPIGIEQPCRLPEGFVAPTDIYIGAFAYIGDNVKIGKNVKIYPQVYIGNNVEIGDDCIIRAGVRIYEECKIGNRCTIHSGTVIGADGFGFAPGGSGYEKIPQLGNVVIEDDVEIGANTTIDRATFGSTVIGRGTKLDNLIQVGHNVEIGENNVFAAQTGVAGSTKIGSHNMVGGQVGFAGHIKVGNGNQIGAQSGIPNSVGDCKRIIGYPAVDARTFAKTQVYLKNLGKLFENKK
jgi:UDP-3-O-[3-hydroxymyristoyl] glucosamine N-acyltransferase